MNQMLEQITPLFITFILGAFVVVINGIGRAVTAWVETKREEVIAKIGMEEYQRRKSIAYDVWNIVEEHFRLNDLYHTIDDKANMFTDVILERIPALTKEDIDFLRQAVAGEINYGKERIAGGKDE